MRQCERCGKSYVNANTRKKLRGIFNPTNRTKKRANLQHTRDYIPGKRSLICTQCMRTLSKTKKK